MCPHEDSLGNTRPDGVKGHRAPRGRLGVLVAEQVQVECKIKKRSGQVRWRAAGSLGLVKGDEKLTACFFSPTVSAVENLDRKRDLDIKMDVN